MRRLFLGALHRPNPLLSEALGAPGSPQRTWDDDDLSPMLSQKDATGLSGRQSKSNGGLRPSF